MPPVGFLDFGTNGLTVSPTNGTVLNTTLNGTTVTIMHTVSCKTVVTNNLIVTAVTTDLNGLWVIGDLVMSSLAGSKSLNA